MANHGKIKINGPDSRRPLYKKLPKSERRGKSKPLARSTKDMWRRAEKMGVTGESKGGGGKMK